MGLRGGRELELSVRVARLGLFLEPSWRPFGPSWKRLGSFLGSGATGAVVLLVLHGCVIVASEKEEDQEEGEEVSSSLL